MSIATSNTESSTQVQTPLEIGSNQRGGSKQIKPGSRSPKNQQHKLRPQSESTDGVASTAKLSEIVVDPGLQSRAAIDQATVRQYKDRIQAGDTFPPLQLFEVNGELLLASGFHTYQAAVQAGLDKIKAVIHQGDRKAAIMYSLQSNTMHGLPRSNADKQHAARLTLQEFPHLSDGSIADLLKVSQPFVSTIRRELNPGLGSEVRVGRDGKRRKSPKSAQDKKVHAIAEKTIDVMSPIEAAQDVVAPEIPIVDTGVEFDQARAWEPIEQYLRQQIESWPKAFWTAFGNGLKDFADRLRR
jgi:hypothetical protein